MAQIDFASVNASALYSAASLIPAPKANGGKIARNTGPDPRLVFLERASARLFLVEAGEMTLDEAFEGLVTSLQCACSRELVERWEQNYPPSAIKRRKTFR